MHYVARSHAWLVLSIYCENVKGSMPSGHCPHSSLLFQDDVFLLLGCSDLFNNKAVQALHSITAVPGSEQASYRNAVTVLSDPSSFSAPSLLPLTGWCVFFLPGFCASSTARL